VPVEIEPARTDEDLLEWAAVTNAIWRHDPLGREELREIESRMREPLFLVARDGGAAVGAAFAGIEPGGEPTSRISVVTPARGRGVGSTLLGELTAWAERRGLARLRAWAPFDDPDGVPWALRRGFAEIGHELVLALDLANADPPPAPLPEGVELVTLAERPDLLPALHRIGEETYRDVPGYEEEQPWPYVRWVETFMSGPTHLPDAVFVAADRGEPVGFAKAKPKLSAIGAAWNHYTGVRGEARGRGIGRALKTAQIRWAQDAGFELLLTRNEERNAPIRHLNESLGYRPHSGRIRLERPLL